MGLSVGRSLNRKSSCFSLYRTLIQMCRHAEKQMNVCINDTWVEKLVQSPCRALESTTQPTYIYIANIYKYGRCSFAFFLDFIDPYQFLEYQQPARESSYMYIYISIYIFIWICTYIYIYICSYIVYSQIWLSKLDSPTWKTGNDLSGYRTTQGQPFSAPLASLHLQSRGQLRSPVLGAPECIIRCRWLRWFPIEVGSS